MPPSVPILNVPPLDNGYDPKLKPPRRNVFSGHLVIVECVPGDTREEMLLASGYTLTNQKIDPNTGVIHANVWAKTIIRKGKQP